MNWFNRSKVNPNPTSDCAGSILYDETTFYNRFAQDLLGAKKEVIIESPFISAQCMRILRPVFEKLVKRGVKVYVITRNPKDHSNGYEIQSEEEITYFETIGVQVLLCVGNHHRKLGIIDRTVTWEGSLNILSQIHSREIMRRIESKELTEKMFEFLKLGKYIY